MNNSLSLFVKEMRKRFGLTQVDLAAKAGVGLRFVRELEQGKQTLRIDKVNQVLALFGHDNNRGQQMVCRRQTIAHPRIIQ